MKEDVPLEEIRLVRATSEWWIRRKIHQLATPCCRVTAVQRMKIYGEDGRKRTLQQPYRPKGFERPRVRGKEPTPEIAVRLPYSFEIGRIGSKLSANDMEEPSFLA